MSSCKKTLSFIDIPDFNPASGQRKINVDTHKSQRVCRVGFAIPKNDSPFTHEPVPLACKPLRVPRIRKPAPNCAGLQTHRSKESDDGSRIKQPHPRGKGTTSIQLIPIRPQIAYTPISCHGSSCGTPPSARTSCLSAHSLRRDKWKCRRAE